MAEVKRYQNLEHALCKELEKLDRKYAGDAEMTEQDAERARNLYHALKCAERYYELLEEREDEHEGMSEARGRSYRGGRNVSRGYYPEDGYSGRWSPREYIDPYYDRRY